MEARKRLTSASGCFDFHTEEPAREIGWFEEHKDLLLEAYQPESMLPFGQWSGTVPNTENN